MRIIAVGLVSWWSLAGFAQDSAASRPEGVLTLPVAEHAKPLDERDPIVIEVFRAASDTRPPPAPEDFARDWRLRFEGRTHRTDADDLGRLASKLRALVLPTLSAESDSRMSTRALVIRADAEAPWACIATLLQYAASAGLLRVSFAVRGAAEGPERVIACPLPLDRRPADARGDPVMRIGVVWRPDPEQPWLGRVLVTHGVTVLSGEKELEKVYYSDTKEVPVRVECDGRVPWNRVVDVLDVALRTGKRRIELTPEGALSSAGMIGRGPIQRDPVDDPRMGGGRLGRRNAQRGSIQQTEKSVIAGLEWLKRHQNPDGSWDSDGFPDRCDGTKGAACTGRGAAAFDVGATSLALLAFLGAGFDTRRPSGHVDTVRNGVRFLEDQQDAEGCYGPRDDPKFVYGHACATIAMCEAYASTKELAWRKSAERAVKFILAAQNPLRGWRYGVKPGKDDTSVTGWMIMALQSAKDAGLAGSVGDAIESGIAFLDSVTDEKTGRTGYMRKGETPVRFEATIQKWPPDESEALTALALFTRLHAARADVRLTQSGAKLLVAKLPKWDEALGSIDMYYWYWGTLAMFQIGGEGWERWNKALKSALIEHQVKNGCAEGSWDPKDPWGEEGGRVYSTALMTLCLEVYYRYPKKG
jgi:biopolymer transport protein ExbD